MVHVNVWGPYPIEGFDGTRYFLLITDDCTWYTWSARFSHKYQLLEVFKSLVRFIQKAYNIIFWCCRLDNEFENGLVGRWCDTYCSPSPKNPLNPMRTTRMESLKEPIVRFEKKLHLWYWRRLSLDKSQRSS